MKKQKVLLKKLQLSKTKIAEVNADRLFGGYLFNLTDNGCSPEKSVWPDICPVSHNCPPATHDCPTHGCQSAFYNSAVCQTSGCQTVGCATLNC